MNRGQSMMPVGLKPPCLSARGSKGTRLPGFQRKKKCYTQLFKAWFLNYYFSNMIYALHPLVPIYLKSQCFTKPPGIKRNVLQNKTQLFSLRISQELLQQQAA